MTLWAGAVWRGRTVLAGWVIPPLVHLVPLNRLIPWLTPPGPFRRPDVSPDDRTLAGWVDRLLARLPWPWRRTCLKRGTVLFYLLARAGRPAELRIGVRRGPGTPLTAHAWLVRDGTVILEPHPGEVGTFETIARFPEPSEGLS